MRMLWAAVAGVCFLAAGVYSMRDGAGAGRSPGAGRHDGAQIAGGEWRKAELVRGLPVIGQAGHLANGAISCSSPGNCIVGGSYWLRDPAIPQARAFLLSQIGGAWGPARHVPGLAPLDKGLDSSVGVVSCASAGNCTAAGTYRPVRDGKAGASLAEPFVISQFRGAWGRARPLPDFASLNTGRAGAVTTLSCTGLGECSAGGYYTVKAAGSAKTEAFVTSQVHGRWLPALEAPGIAVLNAGGNARITSLSCVSPGNCAAGGFYLTRHGRGGGFLLTQIHGLWTWARPVGGLPRFTLRPDLAALVSAVSCAAPGDCAAGGSYPGPAGVGRAIVVDEVHGRWAAAKPIAGIAARSKRGMASVTAMSCTAPGDCTAAGYYSQRPAADSAGPEVPFVVSQVRGKWGAARPIPGLLALDVGDDAAVTAMSCTSPGNCAIGGTYADGTGHSQAFLASQVGGAWGVARQVPGVAALGAADSGVDSISCPAAGTCTAMGDIELPGRKGPTDAAFVVSQN